MRWFALVGCLAIVGLAGCGDSPPSTVGDRLSGKVTLDGEPVEFEMLIVADASGKEGSSPRMSDGTYQILNPPKGALRFKFAGGPPMIPDPSAPNPVIVKPTASKIPAKYATFQNDLKFDYTGGQQTYDLTLTK